MRIAVVGSGYVGLVTGVGLASLGHEVVCAERDRARVARVNAGRPPFFEPGLPEALAAQLAAGRFRATADLADALAESRVSIVAVGTPPRAAHRGEIDLSQVLAAAGQIGAALPRLPAPHAVVVKSTVVPGTTEGPVRRALERRSRLPRERFGLAANPEFLREGSALRDFLEPDRIVIGAADPRAEAALRELYAGFDCPLLRTSPVEAELTKYASNALLATLVSFSNELARFCEALPGADVDAVLDGLALDRRFSPPRGGERIAPEILGYLRAGSGYGGSCLPKDLDALRALGGGLGVPTPLLDAVALVNEGRPLDLVRAAERELGSLAGRDVAVLGLAFKPGTDDVRASPGARVVELLRERGARVRSYDPLVAGSCGTLREALEGADAALLVTAWPEFREADWPRLAAAMRTPLLLDGRNALRGVGLPPALRYRPVGRRAAPAAPPPLAASA